MLYSMVKQDSTEADAKQSYFIILVEFLQLLSFSFAPDVPWELGRAQVCKRPARGCVRRGCGECVSDVCVHRRGECVSDVCVHGRGECASDVCVHGQRTSVA